VLKLAGVKSGEVLRGKELALFLVVNRRSLVTMAVVINMVAIVSPIVPTAQESRVRTSLGLRLFSPIRVGPRHFVTTTTRGWLSAVIAG
jgi:hypothetical protein